MLFMYVNLRKTANVKVTFYSPENSEQWIPFYLRIPVLSPCQEDVSTEIDRWIDQ